MSLPILSFAPELLAKIKILLGTIGLLASQATEPSPKAFGDSLAGRFSPAGIVVGGVVRGHGWRHAVARTRHVVANASLAGLGSGGLLASIGSGEHLIARVGSAWSAIVLLKSSILLLVVPLGSEGWLTLALEVILMIRLH